MFTSIISFLTGLFKATSAVSGEITQRDAENNSVSQQSNAEAIELQKIRDQAADALNKNDQATIDRLTGP